MTDVSDERHSFSISSNLGLQWHEPRLSYNGTDSRVIFPKDFGDMFWKPDLYFWNAKTYEANQFVDLFYEGYLVNSKYILLFH